MKAHAPDPRRFEDALLAAVAERCAAPLRAPALAAVSGGKRLRGGLALGVAAALTDAEPLLAPAIVVELVHAASLAVDDLPAFDAATSRRGRPALHQVHGEAATILTAHALVGVAFAELLGMAASPEIRIEAATALADLMDGRGMPWGQLAGAGSAAAVAKTGGLFALAGRLGALCAGGTSDQVKRAAAAGRAWGTAYQAWDDGEDGDRPRAEAAAAVAVAIAEADLVIAGFGSYPDRLHKGWTAHFRRLVST